MTKHPKIDELIKDLRLCLKGIDLLDIDTIVNFDDYNNTNMHTDQKETLESLLNRLDLSVKSFKQTVYNFRSYS